MAHGPALYGYHKHEESDISDLGHDDTAAIHDDEANEISALTAKSTPVDADLLLIEDSEASWAKKKVQMQNLVGGSDIVYDSGTDTETSMVASTWTTIDSTSLTVAAGDLIQVETLWTGNTSTSSEDVFLHCDLGGGFTRLTSTATSPTYINVGTSNDFAWITWLFSVHSSSLAWCTRLRTHIGSSTTDGGKDTNTIENAGWEEITSDVTGSVTLLLEGYVSDDSQDPSVAPLMFQVRQTPKVNTS